ncbi:MAG: KH domain-containing protein [Aigarchaeota archaeon]|nr:KH domain-containing protein [Aigarchaeota archaeon]
MTIYFREKEIVTPGQLLSDEGQKPGEGTYAEGKNIFAAQTGLAVPGKTIISVIPIRGPYVPKPGDNIVGVVVDTRPGAVEVDVGHQNTAIMKVSPRLRAPADVKLGDVVTGKISYRGLKGLFLDEREGITKIRKGLLITLTPTKIPRLIGRKGSMINVIKRETGCQLHVGRNGLIVVSGASPSKELAAVSAIRLIEERAHTSGLTDRVTEYLKKA